MSRIVWLIPVAGLTFAAVLALNWWIASSLSDLEVPLGAQDKYDIFKDVSTIVLAFAGLAIAAFGFGVYRILSGQIQRDARHAARQEGLRASARSAGTVGLGFWQQYSAFKPIPLLLDSAKRSLLGSAIALTDDALTHAAGLDKEETANERLLLSLSPNPPKDVLGDSP